MASKDGETPPDSAQCEKKGKQTGITIDSSLIHTASEFVERKAEVLPGYQGLGMRF